MFLNKKILINNKVLIITNGIGLSHKHLYCSMVVGQIIDYNPENNTVNINFNNNNRWFNINQYDVPFIPSYMQYKQNIFAYKSPTNTNECWWYEVLLKDDAIILLERNIKHPCMYVFEGHVLSRYDYVKYKSKSKFFYTFIK